MATINVTITDVIKGPLQVLALLILALPLAAQQPVEHLTERQMQRMMERDTRVVTPGFVALNAGAMGMAALDVALTRRCIAAGTCHETNPLMQGSAGRMYGIALGVQAVGVLMSYKLKKQGSRIWMIAPVVGMGAHGVGVGFAPRF